MTKNDPTLVEVTEQIQPPEPVEPEQRSDVPSGNMVMVYPPPLVNEFRSADDSFPPIVESGTEMTEEQAGLAKAAALATWQRIRIVRKEG